MSGEHGGKDPFAQIRHDLRTPVNQIIGYSELLEEQAEDAGATDLIPDLKKINKAARKLLELQDGFFSAARARELAAPATPAPAPAAAASPAAAPTPAPRSIRQSGMVPLVAEGVRSEKGHLLVVDDNEMNRDMLSRRLKGKGYSVDVAEDGYVALDKVGKTSYDLILLDVMMPGISGLDVLKTLRETYTVAMLPVIMATAKDGSDDIVDALKLGANDYVTKPLDFPVVLARVQTQLTLKRLSEDLERRNQFIRNTFGRYLSDEIVESLLETPEGLRLGGERRSVTIMMSDLRGFTATAERLAPEQVTGMLNVYLGAMADVIMEFRGTIDEFIGDAILVIFGAPIARPDDARRAVACAVAMQRAMEQVNEHNRTHGLPEVEMGIALNTGEVVVGNIGSTKRAKYGVVGTPINLTSRIETYTVGGQVLIAQATLDAAGGDVLTAGTVEVKAKGARAPITAHYVRGIGGEFGLMLPELQEHVVELNPEVPVTYFLVEGKAVSDVGVPATLARISEKGGDVRSEVEVPPLTNIKLRFEGVPEDVYAKVVPARSGRPPGFSMHFTSIPPTAEALLRTLRPSH